MKSYILFLLACILPLQAQYKVKTADKDYIQEGMFTAGGNLSFSSQSFERSDNTRTIFSLTPSVSWFLYNWLSAGLSVRLDNISAGGSSNTDWGAGPSIRYYFSRKRLAPFAGTGYSYGISTSSATNDKYTTQKIILAAGADYFVTTNVAIEAVINYMFIEEKYPDRFSEFLPKLEYSSRLAVIALGINIFL